MSHQSTSLTTKETLTNTKPDEHFPATFRIKKRSDFRKMEHAGISLQTRPFLMVITKSQTDTTRLGLVVSKRINKRAVVRNAIKRKAREVFRRIHSEFNDAYDILMIARKTAPECSFETMHRQVTAALFQHGYLQKKTQQIKKAPTPQQPSGSGD